MRLCPSCNGCTKYQGGLVFSGFSACMLYDCADTCNKYAAWLERKRVRHEKAVALWKEHTEKLRRNKMTRFLDGCSFQEPAWAKTEFRKEYELGWRLLNDRNNKVWKWEHPTKPCVVSIGVIKRPEAEDCF